MCYLLIDFFQGSYNFIQRLYRGKKKHILFSFWEKWRVLLAMTVLIHKINTNSEQLRASVCAVLCSVMLSSLLLLPRCLKQIAMEKKCLCTVIFYTEWRNYGTFRLAWYWTAGINDTYISDKECFSVVLLVIPKERKNRTRRGGVNGRC